MALGLLWAGACDDGPAPMRIGRYVDFTTEDPTKSLCVGSAARLDRHVEQVHNFIGEPAPEELRVPLQVVEESTCPGIACYSPEDRTIYAEQLEDSGLPGNVVEHELTHALVYRVWGDSVPSLEEGLAEALTSGRWGSLGPGAPVRSMLAQTADEIDYVELGRFVRFLVDNHGVEQFKRLYRMTRTLSQGGIEANFETVYGKNFEAIEAEYLSGAKRCRYQLNLYCEAVAEPVGTSWAKTFAASCSDPDSYGSRRGEFERFATQRTVRVDVPGQYRLRASVPVLLEAGGSPFLPQVTLVRCGDCDEQSVRSVLDEGYFTLDPGIYTIFIEQVGDSLVELELELIDA